MVCLVSFTAQARISTKSPEMARTKLFTFVCFVDRCSEERNPLNKESCVRESPALLCFLRLFVAVIRLLMLRADQIGD